MKKWFLFVLFFVSIVSVAQIYMKIEKNGNVTYSDMPMPDAKTINIEVGQTENAAKAEPKAQEKTPLTTKKPYTIFHIISPKNDESIQNQPSLKVEVKLEPALQQGDKIQIYVDGKKTGPLFDKTSIDVGLVDRGTHELYAELVDTQQRNFMQSNVITINFHRARTGFPLNKNGVAPRPAQ